MRIGQYDRKMSVCSASGMPGNPGCMLMPCCELMSYCLCCMRSGQYDRKMSPVCSASGMPCCESIPCRSCCMRIGQYDRKMSAQYVAPAECWVNVFEIGLSSVRATQLYRSSGTPKNSAFTITRHSAGATCRANLSRSCRPHPTRPLKKIHPWG